MYQQNGACYDTAALAAQAAAADHVGQIVPIGSSTYTVNVGDVTGTTIAYTFKDIVSGASITTVTPYTAQPCVMLTVTDGIDLGWMVAGVWLAVFGVMFITRALRGEDRSDYGNA